MLYDKFSLLSLMLISWGLAESVNREWIHTTVPFPLISSAALPLPSDTLLHFLSCIPLHLSSYTSYIPDSPLFIAPVIHSIVSFLLLSIFTPVLIKAVIDTAKPVASLTIFCSWAHSVLRTASALQFGTKMLKSVYCISFLVEHSLHCIDIDQLY